MAKESYRAKLSREKQGIKPEPKPVKYYIHGAGNN